MSRKCEACNGKGEVEWTSVAGVAVDGAVAWNGVKRAKARGWWTMKSRYNVGDVLISTTGIKWTIVFIGERGAVLHTNDGGNISELYCEWITMAEWSKDIPDPTCNGLTLEQFIEHANRGEVEVKVLEGWGKSLYNKEEYHHLNIVAHWKYICIHESMYRIKPKPESLTLKAFEIDWNGNPTIYGSYPATIGAVISHYRIIGYGDLPSVWEGNVPCYYRDGNLHKYKYAIGVREG